MHLFRISKTLMCDIAREIGCQVCKSIQVTLISRVTGWWLLPSGEMNKKDDSKGMLVYIEMSD